jgi:monoamine oxidase
MNTKNPGKFDRRRFLELLATAGVAVYLPACGPDEQTQNNPPVGAGKKALVLGAGLAGLSAAYELQKKGFDVTVLEAQAHVGGRVRTERASFEGGQYAELGAVRVPDVHDHTIAYVEELGLELQEFVSGEPLYFLNGQRFMHQEGMPWPLAGLSPEEAMQGLDMWSTYVAGHFDEFGHPREGTFPLASIVDTADAMTWTEYLKSVGASDPWIHLYTSDNGTEIQKIGALAWMALEVADQDWSKTFHVKGGNDQIPQKLAEKLAGKIMLERVVKKIEHDTEKVRVVADNKGTEESYEADHLVCAIPFSVLGAVEISPALPADKQKAIAEIYLMPSSRAYFQTNTRFWENDPLGKIGGIKLVKTDTVAERVWDLTNTQTGTTGILMSYMQYQNADTFAAVPAAGREAFIEAEIAKFLPGIVTEKTAYFEKVWSEDPWVKGAWTELLPGQWWMFPVLGRAEGRIHFAGEHTSIWAGWMQGAIESGKRVADEVTKTG